MEYYSASEEGILSFITWMSLEDILVSEVSLIRTSNTRSHLHVEL
jgi:hypothetical protein